MPSLPSLLPSLLLPFSYFPSHLLFLKHSVQTLTVKMDPAIALEVVSGGALESAGTLKGQGHPRVLKAVAIYQLVQNYVSILTTSKALPETASVSGLGVTKPVRPRSWGGRVVLRREAGAVPRRASSA